MYVDRANTYVSVKHVTTISSIHYSEPCVMEKTNVETSSLKAKGVAEAISDERLAQIEEVARFQADLVNFTDSAAAILKTHTTAISTLLSILAIVLVYLRHRHVVRSKEKEFLAKEKELLIKVQEHALKERELDWKIQESLRAQPPPPSPDLHTRRRPHMCLRWVPGTKAPYCQHRFMLDVTNCDERAVAIRTFYMTWPGCEAPPSIKIVDIRGASLKRPWQIPLDSIQLCEIIFQVAGLESTSKDRPWNFWARVRQIVHGHIVVSFTTGEQFAVDLPYDYKNFVVDNSDSLLIQVAASFALTVKKHF